MNQDQAFDLLTMGHNVFLTGAAWSGKTYLVNRFITYAREHGIELAVTASTGIAATHLGGMTIHAWSGLGIREELSDRDIATLIAREYLAKRYAKTHILIIDEVSMLSGSFLSLLDRLLRSARMRHEPFGGMQIVLVGDFFQLPPVSRDADVAFAFEHPSWETFSLTVCLLSTQYRQWDDPLLIILSEIRQGNVSPASRDLLRSRNVPVLGDDHTELFTRNTHVDTYNHGRLAAIDAPEKRYQMGSSGPENLVESMKKWCLAPEVLSLKVGARVMFIKNNFEEGYVNGSIGHVRDFCDGLPRIELLSGVMITPAQASWTVEEGGKIKAAITQLPLRLAWAITVHKSQGMTLESAVVDLSDAFVAGQGLVALLRVRSLSGLTLKGFNPRALQINERVRTYDDSMQEMSARSASRLQNTLPERIVSLRNTAIVRLGGSIDTIDVSSKKSSGYQTYALSLELFQKRLPLSEIADLRSLKISSIIAHLGYWRERGNTLDTDWYAPTEPHMIERMGQIHAVFDTLGSSALSGVREILWGDFWYEEIKLAKVFYSPSR